MLLFILCVCVYLSFLFFLGDFFKPILFSQSILECKFLLIQQVHVGSHEISTIVDVISTTKSPPYYCDTFIN